MNANPKTPMIIRIPPHILDTSNDPLVNVAEKNGIRTEHRRAADGAEYEVEVNVSDEVRQAASVFGRIGGRIGGAKGGRASGSLPRTEKQLEALEKARASGNGRKPSTPDGEARRPLRKALEEFFGRPLPNDGVVSKLVHKMSSANVVRKTWPLVAERVPEDRRDEIGALVENLAKVLDSLHESKKKPAAPSGPPSPPVPDTSEFPVFRGY